MSENLTKLREAIRREWDMATKHGRCICATCDEATEDAHAALAAVEQELAALRLSYENASRAHFEATKRIDALTECHAKLEAERVELRRDGWRLDWLEAFANREPLVLHDGQADTCRHAGLGLRPGLLTRTLRQAIDDAMAPKEATAQ